MIKKLILIFIFFNVCANLKNLNLSLSLLQQEYNKKSAAQDVLWKFKEDKAFDLPVSSVAITGGSAPSNSKRIVVGLITGQYNVLELGHDNNFNLLYKNEKSLGGIANLALSPDGQYIVIQYHKKRPARGHIPEYTIKIVIWKMGSTSQSAVQHVHEIEYNSANIPLSNLLVTQNHIIFATNNEIQLWNWSAKLFTKQRSFDDLLVNFLAISKDDKGRAPKYLVSSSALNNNLKIRQLPSGEIFQNFTVHDITSVVISEDNKYIVANQYFQDHIIIFKFTGNNWHLYNYINIPVISIAISQNKYLIIGSGNQIIIWNLDTNTQVKVLECPARIKAVAISDDNKYLIAALYNSSIRIFQKI